MVAIQPLIKNNQPAMIRLPSGQLVPLASIAGALPPPPAAANGNQPMTISAGQSDSAMPAAAQASDGALASIASGGRGGAASGSLIAPWHQPDVLTGDDGSGGDNGLAALIKGIGKAAGGGGSGGAAPAGGSGGGDFLAKIKDFLGLGQTSQDTTGATVPPPIPVQTNQLPDLTPGQADGGALPGAQPQNMNSAPPPAAALPPAAPPEKPGLFQRIGSALGLGSSSPGALPPQQMPMTADGPGTGGLAGNQPQDQGFLGGIFSGLRDKPNPMYDDPATAKIMQDRYGGALPAAPDWFDKLKANPNRMALLIGGLSTMANASKPGATLGGSIGQGALSGINTVYDQREAERKAAEDDVKNASEAKLKQAQADFYGVRGDTTQQNADTNAAYKGVLGDVAGKNADSKSVMADAAMKRATYLASGPGKGVSATQWKHDIWLQSHPGDEQGALDYAAGHRKMSSAEAMRSAYGVANAENNGKVTPDGPEWVDKRAAEIAGKITGAESEGAGALPAPAGKPVAGAPAAAKPTGAVPSPAALRAQAAAAIAKGADPAAVKGRFKKMTGTDF